MTLTRRPAGLTHPASLAVFDKCEDTCMGFRVLIMQTAVQQQRVIAEPSGAHFSCGPFAAKYDHDLIVSSRLEDPFS